MTGENEGGLIGYGSIQGSNSMSGKGIITLNSMNFDKNLGILNKKPKNQLQILEENEDSTPPLIESDITYSGDESIIEPVIKT